MVWVWTAAATRCTLKCNKLEASFGIIRASIERDARGRGPARDDVDGVGETEARGEVWRRKSGKDEKKTSTQLADSQSKRPGTTFAWL